MLGTAKILEMIASVLWILVLLIIAPLIAIFSEYPFFASLTNWALMASPAIPLAIFYALDRIDR